MSCPYTGHPADVPIGVTKEELDFQDKLKEVIGLNNGQIGALFALEVWTLTDLAILDKIAMDEMLKRVADHSTTFMTKLRIRAFADWYHDVEANISFNKPDAKDFSPSVCREQMKKWQNVTGQIIW